MPLYFYMPHVNNKYNATQVDIKAVGDKRERVAGDLFHFLLSTFHLPFNFLYLPLCLIVLLSVCLFDCLTIRLDYRLPINSVPTLAIVDFIEFTLPMGDRRRLNGFTKDHRILIKIQI